MTRLITSPISPFGRTMFETIPLAPADPILGLTEAFKKDSNPQKINLGAGVYTDATGRTPILACVKEAEKRLAEGATSRSYLPIDGDPAYRAAVQAMILGGDASQVGAERAYTVNTPGGTGALRVVGDFLKQHYPSITVWLSQPTWPNHPSIFDAAGLRTASYRWFDPVSNGLDLDAALADMKRIPKGDAVLLHGCCHNPTGVDPTREQWEQIAQVLSSRGLLPIIDFAYQGFGDGLEEDAVGVRAVAAVCPEFIVCSSYSKNFGLYGDRVGAALFVTADSETTQRTASQVKRVIRANFSNPPQHGSSVVTTILGDAALRAQWMEELAGMRNRINEMRSLFVETLNSKGVARDFSFIKRQRGMFSFSGLSKEQVQALRDRYSIYAVSSGRVCVAGMTKGNMDRLCTAIADVLKS